MENRPKNMPRWEWEKSLEKEKEDLLQKNPQIPVKSNILGIIITAIIMLGIVWMIFASMGGEPESWNADVPSPNDGSSRSVYP